MLQVVGEATNNNPVYLSPPKKLLKDRSNFRNFLSLSFPKPFYSPCLLSASFRQL